MLNQILTGILNNPWVLALGTLAFFTVKGILWLVIPFLVIRWRRLVIQRRCGNECLLSETTDELSISENAPPIKRAA